MDLAAAHQLVAGRSVLDAPATMSAWNMMADKLWTNFHDICLVGGVQLPGFETAFRSPGLLDSAIVEANASN
jgi:hypothetical protein